MPKRVRIGDIIEIPTKKGFAVGGTMRILVKVFEYHPLTIFTVLGIVLSIVVVVLNIQYDDGGVRGMVFLVTQIFSVPFWLTGEVLFSLNEGKAIPGQYFVSIAIGLLSAVLIDYLAKTLLKRTTSPTASSRQG